MTLDSGGARSPLAELLTRVAVTLGIAADYLMGDGDLLEAEDEAFRRRYLAMQPSMKAQVRAIAEVLGRMA